MAQHFYPSSRGQIAYDKRGWGDPLLLIHGIYPGASHDEYRRNIDALARHFTVHAIDLLGFGDSDMPRLTYTTQIYEHLLRDFIVEEIGSAACVVASGVSCAPATALAVYNDALVSKLVLISPLADESQTDQPPTVAAKVQQFLLGTLSMGIGLYETVSSSFEIKRLLMSRYANPRNATPERIEALHERANRPQAMHPYLSHLTGHLTIDTARWLRYVRCAVLILWGDCAGEPPTERLLRPAAWSRGKRIEIIPRAAHWPHDEQSAKVNQAMIEFLNAEGAVGSET